ncbi:hypothetical protein GGS23DRAFT_88081 [Durotheca rogersii]|uniref:uncharacterized protein n=1 Tax=Durotheca rogersii TaxID=419775 RepID=UPI0022210ED0|nr:uncharacterized protein GGS23DRAFT_88081 [Durotheca rogersii]KAI5862689.1 hypothetical protein GGS23DRAFT_88081 [Durotheca rogersii]
MAAGLGISPDLALPLLILLLLLRPTSWSQRKNQHSRLRNEYSGCCAALRSRQPLDLYMTLLNAVSTAGERRKGEKKREMDPNFSRGAGIFPGTSGGRASGQVPSSLAGRSLREGRPVAHVRHRQFGGDYFLAGGHRFSSSSSATAGQLRCRRPATPAGRTSTGEEGEKGEWPP